jgi:hypothetical protein
MTLDDDDILECSILVYLVSFSVDTLSIYLLCLITDSRSTELIIEPLHLVDMCDESLPVRTV